MSDLHLQLDKVIIMTDFNIHTDVESDSFFTTLLDSVGFSSCVCQVFNGQFSLTIL